jgi:hypothetical protein
LELSFWLARRLLEALEVPVQLGQTPDVSFNCSHMLPSLQPCYVKDHKFQSYLAKMIRAALFLSFSSSVAFATTCYTTEGQAINLVPCDPTANITTCCGLPDYCLSNGLCFNAGANNLLGNQGCTDPNWGAPCHKYCSGRFAVQQSPRRADFLQDPGCLEGICFQVLIPKMRLAVPPSNIAVVLTTAAAIILRVYFRSRWDRLCFGQINCTHPPPRAPLQLSLTVRL